jgi:hypothetical protein
MELPMPAASRTRVSAAKIDDKAGPPKEPWVSKTAGLPLAQRIDVLRHTLFESIEREVSEGNVRVILWLAERLRVLEAGNGPERAPAEELRAFFDQLEGDELREFAGLAAQKG